MTGVARVKATLYLNAPEEVMLARLLERGECNALFSLLFCMSVLWLFALVWRNEWTASLLTCT